jgi:hypothetical protein
MFWPGEHFDEPPERELKPALGVLWRHLGNWRGLSDDERHFRNEIHHESGVRPERFQKGVTPDRKLRLAFAKQRP